VTIRDDGAVRIVVLDRARASTPSTPSIPGSRARRGGRPGRPGRARDRAGAEGRTFCVGADVGVFQRALEEGTMRLLLDELLPVFQARSSLAEGRSPRWPPCRGPRPARARLALACDLRVIGDKATLSTAYGRVGLVPDGGGTFHLERLIGRARAAELLLLPERTVSGEQAVRWGLALEALPRDQVLPKAIEVAQRLAAGPALVTRLVKGLLREAATRNLSDSLEGEAQAQRVAISDADAAEGIRAAVERRAPVFSGTRAPGAAAAGVPPRAAGTRDDETVSKDEPLAGGPR
jgi:2-(1,2-epoxy-1,2-dihydrophenyl)acetyl-CoA isomerase